MRKQWREKQIERIRGLECGRKLDALVAEYVLGLHVITIEDHGEQPDFAYLKMKNYTTATKEMERVPNYSTVSYAALQVLSAFPYWKMEKGQEGIKVVLSYTEEKNNDFLSSIDPFPQLAEAICKAALVAKVMDNRLIEPLLED